MYNITTDICDYVKFLLDLYLQYEDVMIEDEEEVLRSFDSEIREISTSSSQFALFTGAITASTMICDN